MRFTLISSYARSIWAQFFETWFMNIMLTFSSWVSCTKRRHQVIYVIHFQDSIKNQLFHKIWSKHSSLIKLRRQSMAFNSWLINMIIWRCSEVARCLYFSLITNLYKIKGKLVYSPSFNLLPCPIHKHHILLTEVTCFFVLTTFQLNYQRSIYVYFLHRGKF